jgi:hypothetical protein
MPDDDASPLDQENPGERRRRFRKIGRAVMSDQGGESVQAENVRASPKAAKLVEPLWSHVMVGSLVLAPLVDREDGWAVAVVQERRGQILTLSWRNGRSPRSFTRRLKEVALPHPKLRV